MTLNFGQILPQTAELAALERQKKTPKTNNEEICFFAFCRLFVINSFSYLQVTRS